MYIAAINIIRQLSTFRAMLSFEMIHCPKSWPSHHSRRYSPISRKSFPDQFGLDRHHQKFSVNIHHHHHPPPPMPRRLPIRPPRPSRPPSHPFLPPGLREHPRSLIRRPRNPLDPAAQSKRPPKIVALDSVPRLPLPTNPTDYARYLARIEQIKQLYSPKEFKRLRDQQMQLVLPESPLKTMQGRVRLGVLVWIYASILVWSYSGVG